MDLVAGDYILKNLSNINIILGKNGCGKSTLLKTIEIKLSETNTHGNLKYITPERGGSLIYSAGIEQNLNDDITHLKTTRRNNQLQNFRQQSVAQFRKLKDLFYYELDNTPHLRDNHEHKFDHYIEQINQLLDNIKIKPDNTTFKIVEKENGSYIDADKISSGESELITLSIECLIFEKERDPEKENILFLDEPDVHLHPDLQAKLCEFIFNLFKDKNIKVIIATHSTAILGAFESFGKAHIEFMRAKQKNFDFKIISDEYRKILPIFGAHPLSNLFNQTPILLVEGEDDERIWQHAVRSSEHKLKLYVRAVDGIAHLNTFEQKVEQIISCVYDDAKAYSLRDRDDNTGEINDLLYIKRMMLSCRTAENLLLTTEVLELLGTTWDSLIVKIEDWISKNESHVHFDIMSQFKNSNYNRKNFKIKEIRNDLLGIIGTPKPWETIIGQTIGKLVASNSGLTKDDHSIFNYLGEKIVNILFKM